MTAVRRRRRAAAAGRGPEGPLPDQARASSSTRRSATSAPSTASTSPSRAARTYGLVGESGCGKSTLGRAILRLVEPTAGRVLFDGTDVASLKPEPLRNMRRRMQMVFQDPLGSLDPRQNVESLLTEPLRAHGLGGSARELGEKVTQPARRRRAARRGAAPVPARVLRRPAAADRHRPRHRAGAGPADRRRAGLRPRRLGAGAGAQPARGTAGAARADLPGHRARPRRRPAHQRRGRGHVPRLAGRAGPGRRALRAAAASVHARR